MLECSRRSGTTARTHRSLGERGARGEVGLGVSEEGGEVGRNVSPVSSVSLYFPLFPSVFLSFPLLFSLLFSVVSPMFSVLLVWSIAGSVSPLFSV